jgi:hypothetical protein
MGCAPAAGSRTPQYSPEHHTANGNLRTSDAFTVLRAPPVPAFYEHLKSAGGGAVHQRPFSFLKRPLLLYDDDTVLEFEQVSRV